jgi:integrase
MLKSVHVNKNFNELSRKMNEIVPTNNQQSIIVETDFPSLVRIVLSMVTESSARVYQQTFNKWKDWCADNGIDALELNAATVTRFLRQQSVTLATRQRMLSALRKLAQVLALDYTNPQRRAAYESLKMIRVPKVNLGGKERERQALSVDEVNRLLSYIRDGKVAQLRNRAIIAVLFATGVRRSELVKLEWRDIDLDEGTAHIRYGKRGKSRDIAILDFGIEALREWQVLLPPGRQYVFCPTDKYDNVGADKSISTDTVYALTKQLEEATGITFTPHLARHTFTTESISEGTPVHEVQAQLGHTKAETTLRYSHAADARSRRKKIKTRYGK